MNTKLFALSCLASLAGAAPSADADADAHLLPLAGHHLPLAGHHLPLAAHHLPLAAHVAPVAHPVAYHAGPAPNCVTEDIILITQVCTPNAEQVCSTEVVETQEIEYEKICQDIVDTLCDAPIAHLAPYHHVKRDADADADADAHYFTHAAPHHVALAHHVAPLPVAHHVAPLPVAHAVAHSVTATVKHSCREVTTEHCVDNPKIIEVPVEVEHCHTVTRVTCSDVENKLPKTTCEAVVTTQTHHAAIPAPVAHHADYSHLGYGHHGYGK